MKHNKFVHRESRHHVLPDNALPLILITLISMIAIVTGIGHGVEKMDRYDTHTQEFKTWTLK